MVDTAVLGTAPPAALRQWVHDRLPEELAHLQALVACASVSADPARAGAVRDAARMVRDAMARAGAASAELRETAGHPVVFGTFPSAVPGARTVLVYLHYDVQPEGPAEEWDFPPFSATIDGDRMVGRGAADDKGPICMHLAAIEGLRAVGRGLPVIVKMLVEGEEESGSPSLRSWLAENRRELEADLVVISDTSMLSVDKPSVVMGARGNTALEVDVRTLDHDVHSGKFGGGVANAALVLARLLASLHGPDGRVAVTGFYDKVRPLSDAEREDIEAADPPEGDWLSSVGARAESGEAGLRVAERVWARPTLDVVGMWSGYTGPGVKTIVPALASAKISCRLVADQEPAEVARLVGEHLEKTGAGMGEVTVRLLHGGGPVLTPRDLPAIGAAVAAYEWGYGKAPVFIREGGTIPIAATLREMVGAEVLFLGFGLHGQQEHAPNEWLSVDNFERAINAIAMFWARIGPSLERPAGTGGPGGSGREP